MTSRIIVLIWALAALALAPGAAAHDNHPLEIEGTAITSIVTTHPLAPEVAVGGQEALFIGDGSTWTAAGTTVPVGQLVWGGGESRTWLAGDQTGCMMGGGTAPMQRSADQGETWKEVVGTEGFKPLVIWQSTGTAVATSCTGLFVSTDNGATWSQLPDVPTGFEVTSAGEVVSAETDQQRLLLGLTGEGGTSALYLVDLTDPANPVVTPDLRAYYAVGALTGWDDTLVVGAMDGVWVSTDDGATWERHAEGLEDLVLEQDPAEAGLPEDADPRNLGISAISPLPGEKGGLIVGTSDGLYVSTEIGAPFTQVEGTAGRVEQVQVSADGTVLYRVESQVFVIEVTNSAS
jgi:hypothetical protein